MADATPVDGAPAAPSDADSALPPEARPVIGEVLESPAARFFDDVASEPGSAKPDPILVADDVSRSFGGLTAVHVAHLEVQRGAITGLIGPNGAGKTTFFNLLTGFDKPDSGTWSFDGALLAGEGAHHIARTGMVRTFQLTKALARLSVMDNMKLGAQQQGAADRPARLSAPPFGDQGPHLNYAVQWFSFAAIALIGTPLVVRRQRRRRE